jgi:hypothetical protein
LTFTEYSCISAQSFDGVSTSIEEVQVALLGLISKEDIIVGHSLENDLHALRLFHLCVVDTAVLFRTGGRKHAFRSLTAELKEMLKDDPIISRYASSILVCGRTKEPLSLEEDYIERWSPVVVWKKKEGFYQ